MFQRRSKTSHEGTGRLLPAAITGVALAAVAAVGLVAGLWGGSAKAEPVTSPAAAPMAAPSAQAIERLATLRIYGNTVVCNTCNRGESNRTATAGSESTVDPFTGNVPEDPPYADPEGPFSPLSPEAPRFDYVTWNPAWISERLNDQDLIDEWPGLEGMDEVSRDSAIRIGGENGSQKVWLRHWYEPTHLDKDLNADNCLTDDDNDGDPDAPPNPRPSNDDEWYPAIMTELTYVLLENDLPVSMPDPDDLDDSAPRPACGRAGATRIVFPVGTRADALDPSGELAGQGLTSLDADFDGRNDMVNVASEITLAGELGVSIDFDGDNVLDDLNTAPSGLTCNELVVLHTDAYSLEDGETLQFLDHFVRVQSVADNSAVLQVWYNGDLLPRLVQTRNIGIGSVALAGDVGPLQILSPGDDNLGTVPIGAWFLSLQDADVRDGTATLILGRALGAPCASMESVPNVPNLSAGGPWFLKRFYVDGHEYNTVALHTCDTNELQYISLRAPLPKVDVTIEQHSVRLEGYEQQESLRLPPPFNHEHTILEDVHYFEAFDPIELDDPGDEIERPKILYMGGPIGPVAPILGDEEPLSYTGRDPLRPVGPYEDYLASHWFWVEETVNESFLGQLREKYGAVNAFADPAAPDSAPDSFFYNEQIFTRPWNYTEFVLPERMDPDAAPDEDPAYNPDGYYVTSGWINPTARWRQWIMPDDGVPDDVPPIPPDLALNFDRYVEPEYGAPRRASFIFDPDDADKIFLNMEGTRLYGGYPIDDWLDDLRSCDNALSRPSIRYGAGDITAAVDTDGYPVEVLPYTDPFAPFNPQHPDAPRVDSLTFNPAYMDEFRNSNEDLRLLYQQIANNGQNARQKVYNRLWYQPDYVTKIREVDDCDRDLTFLAMMQEYTYLYMDTTDNPIAVPAGTSRMAFPIATRADELPVPEQGGVLPAGGEFGYGLTTFDANFDGFDEASTVHTESSLAAFLDAQWQSNRPMIPGIPPAPLDGPVLDFDGDGATDDFDEDCISLNGNEMVVFAIESLTLDMDDATGESASAMFLDHLVTLENVTPGARAQFRFYFTGGNPADARPEVIGGLRSLDIGDAAIADRFQDRVTLVRPGESNPGTDGAWFVFLEDVATDAERVTITIGRALGASHTAIDDGDGSHDLSPGDPWYLKRFYVDGHEYNVAAVMTRTLGDLDATDPAECNEGFAFLTIRTPVPKGNFFNPQDSLFQQGYFLDDLPDQMSVMPPFNVDHTIAVDVERLEDEDEFAYLPEYDACVGPLAAADPLVQRIREETREDRFGTELRETLDPSLTPSDDTYGWQTHQTIVTPWDYTDVEVPEGQQYLLTLNWRSPAGRLAFYGCTREEPGPFDVDTLPVLTHDDIAAVADGWIPGIVPPTNNPTPPQPIDPEDPGDPGTVPYYDVECSDGDTVRVKVFYDPETDDDIYVNERPIEIPVFFADLEIDKRASEPVVAPGEELIYTITVRNNGPDDVDDAVVTDELPDGVSYVGDTDGCVEGPPQRLTCDVGAIAAGDEATFALLVEVDMSLEDGTELTNVAVVSSAGTLDPDPSNNEDDATVNVRGEADLEISKGASDLTPGVGEQLVYFLSVTNNGPSQAMDVVVVDTLPIGTSYEGDTDSCVEGPVRTLTCSLGDIDSGDNVNFAINVMIDNGLGAGTPLTNLAEVSGSTFDPNLSNNQDDVTVIVTAEADLALTKTASSDEVLAGELLTYTLLVENLGPSDVPAVEVVDALPAGTSFVSSTGACVEGPPGTLSCDLGPLDAGDDTSFDVTVRVSGLLQDGVLLTNVAVAEAPAVQDPDPSNNSDIAQTVVRASADLSIQKDAPSTVAPGGQMSYELLVRNDGPSTAVGVLVTDTLPAGVTHSANDAGCVEAGNQVLCDLGDLDPGDEVLVTIVVDVAGLPADTVLVNMSEVGSGTDDPDTSNNDDDATTTVSDDDEADLRIAKEAPDTVPAGGNLVYLIRVTNGGPDDAENVVVTDELPTGVSFVNSTGGCFETVPDSGVLTCPIGDIAAGDTVVFQINVTVGNLAPGTVLTNEVSVSSATPDPDLGNNEDDADTTVTPGGQTRADLSIEKSAPASIQAGEDMTYTLLVRNLSGSVTAEDVEVVDVLPFGVSYISDDAGCDESALPVLVCDLGDLAPGALEIIQIRVQVGGGVPAGTVLVNSAAVTSSTPDPIPGNNLAQAFTRVRGGGGSGADLAIRKSATPSPTVLAGTMLTYDIDVENLGPEDAPVVLVTDTLPSGVSYMSDTAGCTVEGPGLLECDLGSLDAGDDTSFQINVLVSPSLPNDTELTNEAEVQGFFLPPFFVSEARFQDPMAGLQPLPDPNPENNVAQATVTVVREADLGVDKDASDPTPDPGQTFSYAIEVKNAGPSDAANVVMTDTIPAGLTYVSDDAGCDDGGLPELSCNLGTIPAGETETVNVTVEVGAGVSPGTVIVNEAGAVSDEPDPDLGDNTDTATVVVGGGSPTDADLLIAKDVNDTTPMPGDTITFTVRVINQGPATAQDVVVTDTLPAGLTYVSDTDSCDTSGLPVLVCSLIDVPALDSEEFDILVTVDGGAQNGDVFTNIAEVGSTTPDPNPDNNDTERSVTVFDASPQADLEMEKTVSTQTPVAGDTMTYTLSATNNGPMGATGVTIEDTLPAGLTYLSDDGGCDTGSLPDLSCDVGDLAENATATVNVVVLVDASLDAGTQLTNGASVDGNEPDPNPGNNDDDETVTVRRVADLRIQKTASPNPVEAGQQVVFSFQVDNLGPSDTDDVLVTDTLPSGVSYVSDTAGCDTSGLPELSCDLGSLASGAFTSFDVTVLVDLATAGMLSNTAYVSSPAEDPEPGDNESTVIVTVIPPELADMRVVKTTVNLQPFPGDLVTFNLQVINDGPDTAENVVVTDVLPDGLTYVSNTGGCVGGSPILICNFGDMDDGDAVAFNIMATVDGNVGPDTVLTNNVGVTSDTPDPDLSNNDDSASVTVQEPDSPPLNVTCAVTGVNGDQIRVEWIDNSNFETEFLIETSIDGGPFVPLDTVPSTTQLGMGSSYMYTTAPLLADTGYRFRVLARNPGLGLTSSYSNVTSTCTTDPAPPDKTACYRGQIELQGRTDHGGVLIYMDKIPAATTDSEGYYEFCGAPKGKHKIKARTACYLDAYESTVAQGGQVITMPYTALPGGDTNNNGSVDIYDLVKVGAAYDTRPPSDPQADCTNDNQVNLFDLVLVSGNYGLHGPVPFGFDRFGMSGRPASVPVAGVDLATFEAVAPLVGEALGGLRPLAPRPSVDVLPESELETSGAQAPLALVSRRLADDEVEVDVLARGIRGLYGFDFQLGYDAEQVEVIDALAVGGVQVTPGPDWQSGMAIVAENRADPEAGTVDMAASRIHPAPSLEGEVVLATIRFRLKAPEVEDAWGLEEVKLLDKGSNDIPVRWTGTEIESEIDWDRLEHRLFLPIGLKGAEIE